MLHLQADGHRLLGLEELADPPPSQPVAGAQGQFADMDRDEHRDRQGHQQASAQQQVLGGHPAAQVHGAAAQDGGDDDGSQDAGMAASSSPVNR